MINEFTVELWPLVLDVPESQFAGYLPPAELAYAERFKVGWVKSNFIVMRGFLRLILTRYLDKAPQELEFTYNACGKPSLIASSLQFNISHTKNLGLIACTLEREVGVDVEYLRTDIEYEKIAARFFTTKEYQELLALPGAKRQEAFFNYWVRKEAYLKALGLGLTRPLNTFSVNDTAEVLYINGLQVSSVQVPSGYVAAVAFVATEQEHISMVQRWC